ncbi:unnamed protein product [Ophioblennius macclurei]
MESVSARNKLGCMRQDNTRLTIEDEELISDLDTLQYELPPSTSQVRVPRVGINSYVAALCAQIHQLEAGLEAQAQELKAAELRAECCQETAVHSDMAVESLTEELSTLREELDERTALGKRAEKQRNQALQNAEQLKDVLKSYKATVSVKLQKAAENESKLQQCLVECNSVKEELKMKFRALERENADQSQKMNHLTEELNQAKVAAARFKFELKEAAQKSMRLEQLLADQGVEDREKISSLRTELEDVRALNHSLEQRMAQSHLETQQCHAELASMEAILALLHQREGAGEQLCVQPCMLPQIDYSGAAQLVKLKPGEGYQQLLRGMQSVEAERKKQSGVIERLQEQLSQAQGEISTLQSSMSQRALHYQNLQTELLEKVHQATDTVKELNRKSSRIASLERQLQEKSSAYGQVALKNTELENQLQEKTDAVQHYQTLLARKKKEHQKALEKCKDVQAHEHTEQQHRIEMLQLSVENAQSRLLELELELSSLRRERDEAQESALQLQSSLNRLKQEKQMEVRHKEEILQNFKEQKAQSAAEVSKLQSSLDACREEMDLHLKQMEEAKMSYEEGLRKSKEQASSLQEKLCNARLVCESSGQQNLQLQLSLQQQKTVLAESADRVSELEESQSRLKQQVSNLELQLERAKVSLLDEVRTRDQDAQVKDKNMQETNQLNAQLSKSVSHLSTEMKKYRSELVCRQTDVEHLRTDLTKKASQITTLEESLQNVRSQLASRSETVLDLEEKLRRCEADRFSCTQEVLTLQGQLQAVRTELADTLETLKELRDVLQRTQTVSDERQASVEKLTVQLSETQKELEERTHEVLDVENALKERQGELQQRAKLLGQLDVAIREHKQELEKKVESLQKSLGERESELKAAQRNLRDRNTKVSQDLSQQLYACQQKQRKQLEKLEKAQAHCEALTGELDAAKLQSKQTEARLRAVEEELTQKEARWLQSEAELQRTVTALERELELEKDQHCKELDSLQQTRGQLLKVSEQISSSMRSSQEQLTVKLQQSQSQLEQAKVQLEQAKAELDRSRIQENRLQTQLLQSQERLHQTESQLQQSRVQSSQLHAQIKQLSAPSDQSRVQAAPLHPQLLAMETPVERSNDAMVKKTRTSSLGRIPDGPILNGQPPSLPALNTPAELPAPASLTQFPTTGHSPSRSHPSIVRSPSHTRLSLPAHSNLPTTSGPQPPEGSADSSLDLPLSLKAALREAQREAQWEESSSPYHSWQGFNATDATAASDLSFNPLTYRADGSLSLEGEDQPVSESRRESTSTLVALEDEQDLSSLTGMLRFVNQTLAMQEDPSPWLLGT